MTSKQDKLERELRNLREVVALMTPLLHAFRDSDHSYDRAPTPEGQAVLDAWDSLRSIGLV